MAPTSKNWGIPFCKEPNSILTWSEFQGLRMETIIVNRVLFIPITNESQMSTFMCMCKNEIPQSKVIILLSYTHILEENSTVPPHDTMLKMATWWASFYWHLYYLQAQETPQEFSFWSLQTFCWLYGQVELGGRSGLGLGPHPELALEAHGWRATAQCFPR